MANSFNEYLKRGETTWADIVSRVIGELYQDDRRMGYEAHDAIYAMRFVPSSPILRNAGLAAPMMTSCFVLDVEDDIASIMDSLKNTVMIQKYGGGVGINFSKIRPEGSLVRSTGGLASGPTSFARFWDAAMEVIRQGGWRKGAMMGVLDWQHPDLDLWLSAKEVEGILTNFNLSVGLTRGTPDYIIERIAQRMWVNGEPGVLYLDNINDANPYDVPLRATNPCHTGDTKIWTIHGPRTFEDLAREGKDVKVLTQTKEGKLVFRLMRRPHRTGTGKIWRVTFDDGSFVEATADHKLFLKDGGMSRVDSLKVGDRITSVHRYKANSKGYFRLTNGEDEPLEHHVVVSDFLGRRPYYPEEHCHHISGDKKDNAPENLEVIPSTEHNRMGMFGEENPMSGVWDERNPLYGRDVTGENNPRYLQDVTVEKVRALKAEGLTHQEVADKLGCSITTVKARWKLAKTEANHVVVSVEDTGKVAAVYNGTVEETHSYYVVVGENTAILSKNCGEQPLPPFGACCLGSIDLRKMLRWEEGIAHFDWDLFRETIRIGMEVLNRVIDRNWWPIPETGEFARRWRPVGLGVMGLADTMILLGIPYASPEGRWFVESLTSYMKSWSRGFSQDNVTTLSMPPTGTTGMLAGVIGTGIEPVFSLNFTKQVDSGEYDFPVLPLIAKAAARYDYELTAMDRYVILDTGSAQGTALPDGFKEVLLTATEMGPGDHLEIVERAQRYVDSAISKTVNVPNNTTPEQIAQYIRWGGEHGLKGITFYRTGSRDVEALVSCATGTCDF